MRMKKLAMAAAIASAFLLAGSGANATEESVVVKAGVDASQTDTSARRRHYRHRYRVVHRVYRPYYSSYGYIPAPTYYAPAPYYYGGPTISFGFGGGGWRGGWGHHHHHRHW